MFSKELENLIQASLEDGILEEYEKAALVKRAQREGVDLDELEIYINSLLQKRQRELREKKTEQEEKHEQQHKEAFGRTCPNCGKQVPPLTLICDCGYEFSTNRAVSSVQQLMDKIEEIKNKSEEALIASKLSKEDETDAKNAEKLECDQRIRDAISMFPVPNTKEDIVEFLSLSAPNSKKKGGILGTRMGRLLTSISFFFLLAILLLIFPIPDEDMRYLVFFVLFSVGFFVAALIFLSKEDEVLRWNKNATVWRAKFDQVLMKGRSLRGDPEFQQQLDYYENIVYKNNEKNWKKGFVNLLNKA
jgi:hypothetical protein